MIILCVFFRALKARGRGQTVVAIHRRQSTGSLEKTPSRGRGWSRGRGQGTRSVGSTPLSQATPSATPLRVAVVQEQEVCHF